MARPLVALAALLLVTVPAIAGQDGRPVTATQMLDEARRLANGDPRLLAEIDAAQADTARGVLGSGPTSVRRMVPAGASWSLPFARRPGEPLTIAVRRIGDTPVSLAIVDSNGKQLCADISGGPTLACRIPPGSGTLTARVANGGSDANEVLLLMN